MPKPLLSLDILNNCKHYPSPRVCVIIIIRSKKLLPDEAGLHETHPKMTGPPAHTESAAFTSCSRLKQNTKPPLKSRAQFQWMQIHRPASFNYTESFQPPLSLGHVPGDQLWHPGSLSKFCFPKGFGSMSDATQESCFTEITNCKLFFKTKMKGSGKGSWQKAKCQLYHGALEHGWKFLQAVWLFQISEVHFLTLIHSIH